MKEQPMSWAEAEAVIMSKNFYSAQGLGSRYGFRSFETVILAKTKKEAEEVGRRWQSRCGFEELNLYRNNYRSKVRGMLMAGNYYRATERAA